MSVVLLKIAHQSARDDGVDANLNGGGPLASFADLLARKSSLPINEPVFQGIKLSVARVQQWLTTEIVGGSRRTRGAIRGPVCFDLHPQSSLEQDGQTNGISKFSNLLSIDLIALNVQAVDP